MENKILSIVIPTYNMEAYLPRCLESLLGTCEILKDLQVLVVNDGSKDGSSKIAHEFESKYPDTIDVIDKENGNYGSCVNVGLKNATGKYFRILDADDCVNNEGLVRLVSQLRYVDADAIFTDFEIITEGKSNGVVYKTNVNTLGTVLDIENVELLNLHPQYDFAMHKITYRTSLLKEIGFRQTEGISYTDTEYVYYPFEYVNNVIVYDFVLYKYFVGREGQTIDINSKIKNSSHLRTIMERMLIESNPLELEKNRDKLRCKILTFTFSGYYHILLVLSYLNSDSRVLLFDLDSRIWDSSSVLYEELSKVKCLGLPYIKMWRKFNLQIIKPWFYLILKKVFR